jgi:protein TonB
MIARYGGAIGISVVVTFGLFFIMQFLVATGEMALGDAGKSLAIDITMEDEEMDVQRKARAKPKKQDVRKPPPPARTQIATAMPNSGPSVEFDSNFGNSLDIGIGTANLDRGAYPKFRVQQQYPRRAQERGIEGWVVVRFTITKTGGVKDAIVVESSSSLFERSAMKAVAQYKYEPLVISGEPQESTNQHIRLVYEMAE